MDDLVTLIIATAQELNDSQEIEISGNLCAETRLFGKNGMLDSLGLVSLVVAVEQALEDKFGIRVALADEKALSQANSPYQTIGTLADYADSLIGEQRKSA